MFTIKEVYLNDGVIKGTVTTVKLDVPENYYLKTCIVLGRILIDDITLVAAYPTTPTTISYAFKKTGVVTLSPTEDTRTYGRAVVIIGFLQKRN